jgi:hypothetical protein
MVDQEAAVAQSEEAAAAVAASTEAEEADAAAKAKLTGACTHPTTFQLNLSRFCHCGSDANQRTPQLVCNDEPKSGRV